jgi:tetratricopeptide (TPR) repeat protein
MWPNEDGKLFLEPVEGRRILAAARSRGWMQTQFADKVSPGRADPTRHLRAVLLGNRRGRLKHPLTADYESRIAEALHLTEAEVRAIADGRASLEQHDYPAFEVVERLDRPSAALSADRFYQGHPPTWEELEAGFDLQRLPYTRSGGIAESLQEAVETRHIRTIAIIGAGGTGKTTTVRRAAYDVAKRDSLVLAITSEWRQTGSSDACEQLRHACAASRRAVVLVVDDLSDELWTGSPLQELLAAAQELPVVILCTEHPDRWAYVANKLPFLRSESTGIHRLHRLQVEECEALVDRAIEYEISGRLKRACELSREDRLALCIEGAQRHLVVAMLQMRNGERFEAIIRREYDRVQLKAGREAYALVAYCETLRLQLPLDLLLRTVGVAAAIDTEEFFQSTDGLFDTSEDACFTTRHRLVARTVTKHALSRPESKRAALLNVLTSLRCELSSEAALFQRAFGFGGIYKRIVTDFERQPAILASFYDSLEAAFSHQSKSLRKLIFVARGLTERALHEPERARDNLLKATELDDSYSFAHRQLAWVALDQGDWDTAARHAKHSSDCDPDNAKAAADAARILSLNQVRWFAVARSYFERAIDLDPLNDHLRRDLERYEELSTQLSAFGEISQEGLIPLLIWKNLRPGLFFNRLRLGPRDGAVVADARKRLIEMQQESSGSVHDLDELETFASNRSLRGLYVSNAARLEFIQWRQGESTLSTTDLQALFEEGLALSPRDPFAHCWFGTFLKEVRGDFARAMKEYDVALEYGHKSSDRATHDHPLFFNNKALLIIDEISLGLRSAADLAQARQLLEIAESRARAIAPEFAWPSHNLDWCNELIAATAV